MKKTLLTLLLASMVLSLGGCAPDKSTAPDNILPEEQTPPPVLENANQPPEPVVTTPYGDETPIETLLADFAVKIQAGSAGSSLKAVVQAVRLLDWGMDTVMSDEEIFSAVDAYISELDEAEKSEYLIQLELLDDTYQLLLTPGQESLLESAGCADAAYPWSDAPVPAVESFMIAAGIREVPQLFMESATPDKQYAAYVENCRLALTQRWDAEKMWEHELNANALMDYLSQEAYPTDSAADELGWCLYDINRDGVNELIMGAVSQPQEVYDIMAYDGAKLVRVFEGWNRNVGHVCHDGTVAVRGSGGAARSNYSFYVLSGTSLAHFGSIIHDADYSPNAPWFISSLDDGDVSKASPASEAQAQNLISQYEGQYVSFAFTPFSQTE